MTASFKYKILSLILFPAVLSIAVMNYETWSRSSISAEAVAQPAAAPANPTNAAAAVPGGEAKPVQPAEAYGIIAEKNIFNPERKDFPAPGHLPAELPKPAVRPQVFLSGVVISDDYQAASVSNPGRVLRKGEREAMTLKLGDKIGEYKLTRIGDDRITMQTAGDSFEVLLYDRKKVRTRVEANRAPNEPGAKTAQAPAATPAPGEALKAEPVQKPADPAQERAIAAARPSPGSRPTSYSREDRSRRYSELTQAPGKQPNTGIAESTTGRDKSFR